MNQMQSVPERTGEMRTQSSPGPLVTLSAHYIQAVEGLSMFRDQSGAAVFQIWSDKEKSESGESDSLLQKSSLFKEFYQSLAFPSLFWFFHQLLALPIISSWYHLHVLVLSVLSSSPLAVFLIPDSTA